MLEKVDQGSPKKWTMEFLEKITAYPNEAIHNDCVVAFTRGYEKIVSETQTKKLMWIWSILHDSYSLLVNIFSISLIMSIAKIFIAENQSFYYILYIRQVIKFLK